jgi:hypothetical protein
MVMVMVHFFSVAGADRVSVEVKVPLLMHLVVSVPLIFPGEVVNDVSKTAVALHRLGRLLQTKVFVSTLLLAPAIGTYAPIEKRVRMKNSNAIRSIGVSYRLRM